MAKSNRSAITGRYVTRATAARHSHTTVAEAGSNRRHAAAHRSAISGRYVTGATATRHPRTTISENG